MLFFVNLIFVTNLWRNAKNFILLKTHIGIWDYWRNNYVTIFYTDNAWKYELQSFLNNYFTHKKKTANHFFWSTFTFLLLNMVIISSTMSIFFQVCDKNQIRKEKKTEYILRERDILKHLTDNWNTNVPYFVRLHASFHVRFL